MQNSWNFDPFIWIVVGVITFVAILTGAGLLAKAFNFQRRYLFGIAFCSLWTVVLTAAGVLLPLVILAGQPYEQQHLLADLMMIGITCLVVIAVGSFIVDHLTERPKYLLLGAGACFAIAIFPWIYQVFREPLNDHFRIAITEQIDSAIDTLPSESASSSPGSQLEAEIKEDWLYGDS